MCVPLPAGNVDKFNTEIDMLLSSVKPGKKTFVVVGNFNLNLLNIQNHGPTHSYYNIMVAHRLTPAFTRPTKASDTSATLIDNIYINTLAMKAKATIFFDDTSDHFPLLLELSTAKIKTQSPMPFLNRSYDSASISIFTASLFSHDWTEFNTLCQNSNNSDELYNEFNRVFNNLYLTAFPQKV